jgi:ABC-2 type transport system permease protein
VTNTTTTTTSSTHTIATNTTPSNEVRRPPVWRVIAGRELRDLWLAGRGLPIMVVYAGLLSVTSYLAASNRVLNFLEQRETVSLTLQTAVAVAALVVLVAAADAISGERDRGTLEMLLLTPAPRRAIFVGKAIAALSLWVVAYVISVPSVWYLARGTRVLSAALVGGFIVGALLASFCCALGLVISAVAASSRFSVATSVFVLIALYAPTQLPTGSNQSWFTGFLRRADPFTAGLHYLGELVIKAHGAGQDARWLVGPVAATIVFVVAVFVVANRLALRPGGRS